MPNFDSLTATLARFAGELTPAAIPASVKARIALHFIDSLGNGAGHNAVAAAGAPDVGEKPLADVLHAHVRTPFLQ